MHRRLPTGKFSLSLSLSLSLSFPPSLSLPFSLSPLLSLSLSLSSFSFSHLLVGLQWAAVYAERKELAEYMRVSSQATYEPWLLNDSSVFAQVDAFVQRCHDLLDLAQAQVHFARRVGDTTLPEPVIHGSHGAPWPIGSW